MTKAKLYKTMPMKKIGREYWRLWGTVGTKRLVDWEKKKLKREGYRCRSERFGNDYRVWYLPHNQDMAYRDYERFRRGQ